MKIGHEDKRLRINSPLAGFPVGAEVKVQVDRDGTIKDKYWRRRLADAKTDGCVEFVGKKKTVAPSKEDS